MSTRRNLGGRYVEVRERNTSKGHKGTILKNWSSKKKIEKKSEEIILLLLIFVIILICIFFLLKYYL
jgi:hypothetical protein